MQEKIQSLLTVPEVELVYRYNVKPADRILIDGVDTAYEVLLAAWDKSKIELVEQFYILLLDRSHHCLGISTIATGGYSGCYIDPKIIFTIALKAKASALVLAHNHPSGRLKPSKADIAVTKTLKKGGDLLDIAVVDHLIISPYDFYSFGENKKIF